MPFLSKGVLRYLAASRLIRGAAESRSDADGAGNETPGEEFREDGDGDMRAGEASHPPPAEQPH